MINRVCFKCGEYVQDVWVERIYDEKESIQFSGHAQCINELHNQVKSIKNLDKKSVKKVLTELGLEVNN